MPAAVALRDISQKTRDKASAGDFAGKHKSFPILKPADVAAAASSIGRAGSDNYSTEELQARIVRIAKRKGAAFVAQLPKAWKTDGTKSASTFRPPAHLIVLTDDTAETWIQVLRVGKFWSPRYKDFAVTKATLATMVENFQTITPKAPTELPLDYNHGTNRPDTVEQGKAAGWIQDLELRAEDSELWAHVRLTPEAADLVRNEEYRFVSATFEFDHVHTDGEQRKKSIGPTLMAAALTNTPFVEGMAPVTLAKDAAVSLADDADEAAEALFPFDDIRRRIQAELTEAYGSPNSGGCCAPCWGVYLVDVFDGFAIYCEPDGSKYRVDYSLGTDGDVAFTSAPIEVRVAYEPLPSADNAGDTEMAKTIKVKDAAGNEIELAEDTVKALAKEHAPKVAATVDESALDEIRTSLARIEGENTDLKTQVVTLQTEKREMAAKGLVDALIRAGKVLPKKRDQYVALAMSDRKTFDALTGDLPSIYKFNTETGSGEDGGDLSATQQVLALARDEMGRDAKLTQEQAITRVLSKNRALYEQYKTEAAVRV